MMPFLRGCPKWRPPEFVGSSRVVVVPADKYLNSSSLAASRSILELSLVLRILELFDPTCLD
jgi:hypothetical protein